MLNIKTYEAYSDAVNEAGICGDNDLFDDGILSVTAIVNSNNVLFFSREQYFGDHPAVSTLEEVLIEYDTKVRHELNLTEEEKLGV